MSTTSDPMVTSDERTAEAPPSTTVADSVGDATTGGHYSSQSWIAPFDFDLFVVRGAATVTMRRIINNEKIANDAVESICTNTWDVEPDRAAEIEADVIEAIDMGGLWLQQPRFQGLICLYINSPEDPRDRWGNGWGKWDRYYLERLEPEDIRSIFGAICSTIQTAYVRVYQKTDPATIQSIVGPNEPQNFPSQYQQDHFQDSIYPGWDESKPEADEVPDSTTTA